MEQSKFYQIKNITEHEYTLVGCDGSVITRLIQDVDKSASVFTINDAKPGDVLYLQKDGKEHIIIYRGEIKERFRTFVSAYCAYNGIVDAFCFADVSRYVDIAYGGIMPATKEQRELLFQKMKEAGYEWDADKKELKKIVQKSADEVEPKFKVGDTIKPKDGGHEPWQIMQVDISDKKYRFADGYVIHFSQEEDYELIEQNPAWSEEDEETLKDIITSMTNLKDSATSDALRDIYNSKIDWLKSLRPNNWKPREEQMEALLWCVAHLGGADHRVLGELYEHLKKIKG